MPRWSKSQSPINAKLNKIIVLIIVAFKAICRLRAKLSSLVNPANIGVIPKGSITTNNVIKASKNVSSILI